MVGAPINAPTPTIATARSRGVWCKVPEILSVRGLTKVYGISCGRCLALTGAGAGTNLCPVCGAVVAANNVTFDLREGETLGIMGESGSGKTTVVRTLYFDEPPTAGRA